MKFAPLSKLGGYNRSLFLDNLKNCNDISKFLCLLIGLDCSKGTCILVHVWRMDGGKSQNTCHANLCFSNVYQYVYQGLKYFLQPTKLFKKSQETSQSQNIGSLSGVTYAMVSSF